MTQQPNPTAFKFAFRGMLGGAMLPAVLAAIIIARTGHWQALFAVGTEN